MLDTSDFDADYNNQITSMPKDERLANSEHGSPNLAPLSFNRLNPMSSMELNYHAYNTSITSSPTADEYNFNHFDNYVTAREGTVPIENYPTTSEDQVTLDSYLSSNEDQVPPSAGLSNAFNWSAVDLPLQSAAFTQDYSQAPSYASFDQGMHRPGLTPSSSGEVSEIDDFIGHGVSSPPGGDGTPYITSPGDHGIYNYNISGDSYSTMPQPHLLASTAMENLSMESFLPVPSAQSVDFSEYETGSKLEADSFPRHAFPIHEQLSMSQAAVESPMRTAGPTSDPKWSDSNTYNWI